MKTKMALKLIISGVAIVFLFQLLHGQDLLTGLALVLALLWACATLIFGLIARRRGIGPDNGGYPPYAPVPIPPSRPKPPELTGAARREDYR